VSVIASVLFLTLRFEIVFDAVLFHLVRLAFDQLPYGWPFVQWHDGIDQARCCEPTLAHLADDALEKAFSFAFIGQDLLVILPAYYTRDLGVANMDKTCLCAAQASRGQLHLADIFTVSRGRIVMRPYDRVVPGGRITMRSYDRVVPGGWIGSPSTL
jgi:hypothetical protein